MTLPTYPPELPDPIRPQYRFSRGDGRSRGREDAGPPSVRRRFSAIANSLQFATTLTRAQKARFDRFYDEDTKAGSLPFLMPNRMVDGFPMLDDEGLVLLTEDDQPLLLVETWVCLFGQALPQDVQNDDLTFTISFEIVVLP